MTATCVGCKFVAEKWNGYECRRHPPTVNAVPFHAHSGSEARTMWPTVGADDWCGEWKAKERKPDG